MSCTPPDPTSGTVKVGDSVLKKPTPYEKGVRGKLSNKYMGSYTVRKIEGDKFNNVLDSNTGMTLTGKSNLFGKFIYPGVVWENLILVPFLLLFLLLDSVAR